ncbi:GlxA family transcriptional regulator [Streptomyces sp. NPDC058953]|uniref:GlxA family transcriptional regulator n=1 Tax=unclassified Streptomyces TaxID=2593676 RepID=UPI0036C784C7
MAVIAFLFADGVPGHHLGVAPMVFTTAGRTVRTAAYEVRIASADGSVTTGDPALALSTPWRLDALDGLGPADTVFLAGHDGYREPPPSAAAEALRGCTERGCRMAAIGTGTFTLAALGLLDGRRATTSWPHTRELIRRHPRVTVVASGDPATVDGPFHTAAGIFGGVDLAVDLVERDHGERVAAAVARRIVMPLYDQTTDETADRTTADAADPDREHAAATTLAPTLEWLTGRLHHPLTLADIAAHARVSPSTLNRRFRAQTGLSPLQYLLRARLHEARLLLESTATPIESIAHRTGFGSGANLRHHFLRLTGTGPRAYRAASRVLTATLAKSAE